MTRNSDHLNTFLLGTVPHALLGYTMGKSSYTILGRGISPTRSLALYETFLTMGTVVNASNTTSMTIVVVTYHGVTPWNEPTRSLSKCEYCKVA
jgi:hypothetical protein